MTRSSPLFQLTAALVMLTLGMLMVSDLLLGALPGPAESAQRERSRLAHALAVQLAEVIRAGDPELLESTMGRLSQQVEGVSTLAVRRAAAAGAPAAPGGELVAQAGAHEERWAHSRAGDRLSVPLGVAGRPWGAVEVTFEPDERFIVARWWDEPLVRLSVFVVVAGSLGFGLYLRRALLHLDPASVIPERVQGAFDAMAEGVVVLDTRGRLLLANRAFRALHPDAAEPPTGKALSSLPWLGAGLPDDAAQHPWHQTLRSGNQHNGHALAIGLDIGRERRLVVNCAPIHDTDGGVRGCLVTFDDLTELHHANQRLEAAMQEVTAAKEEVQRKNAELQRLATRDPLTGCLNRRALYDALAPLHAAARAQGTPLSCLVLDIDHFKRINDTHGHGVGDRVIQEVARKLTDCARASDLVCRYGGEEFVVVLPGLPEAEVQAVAERMRQRIEAECGRAVREVDGLAVTASLGACTHGQAADAYAAMIDAADQALYAAKRGGRNRVQLVTLGAEPA